MIARLSPLAASPCKNQTRPLLPTTATMVFSALIALWAAAPNDKSLAADNPEKPNVVLVFADDKYESAGPKAEKLRENRQNARFFARIQIAGNYGKFR
jgi:hypothetical protein